MARDVLDYSTEGALRTAIRRQLLGAATSSNGYFDPTDDDVPLRSWIAEHLGADAVTP